MASLKLVHCLHLFKIVSQHIFCCVCLFIVQIDDSSSLRQTASQHNTTLFTDFSPTFLYHKLSHHSPINPNNTSQTLQPKKLFQLYFKYSDIFHIDTLLHTLVSSFDKISALTRSIFIRNDEL